MLFALKSRCAAQAAVEASTSELMLFGVASLLLSIFEDPIATICSKLPTSSLNQCYVLSSCTMAGGPLDQHGILMP